jgi:hypothetical protein
MLQLTATSELDWWMRTSATTGIGRVQIVYSDDGTTWNNIGDEIVMPIEATWINYNVDLSSLDGNNYYIGFKVYSSTSTSTYFLIDQVFGPEVAALFPDPATLVYPADAAWAFTAGTLQWSAATPAASRAVMTFTSGRPILRTSRLTRQEQPIPPPWQPAPPITGRSCPQRNMSGGKLPGLELHDPDRHATGGKIRRADLRAFGLAA